MNVLHRCMSGFSSNYCVLVNRHTVTLVYWIQKSWHVFYYFGINLRFLNVLVLKTVPVNHCTVFTTIRALVIRCLTMHFTVFLIPAYQQLIFQQQHQGYTGSKLSRPMCFCCSTNILLSLLSRSEKSIHHSLEVFPFCSIKV